MSKIVCNELTKRINHENNKPAAPPKWQVKAQPNVDVYRVEPIKKCLVCAGLRSDVCRACNPVLPVSKTIEPRKVRLEDPNFPHMCFVCSKDDGRDCIECKLVENLLLSHIAFDSELLPGRRRCNHCDRVFTNTRFAIKHVYADHNDIVDVKIAVIPPKTREVTRCSWCTYEIVEPHKTCLREIKAMNVLLSFDDIKDTVECNLCWKSFSPAYFVYEHLYNCHYDRIKDLIESIVEPENGLIVMVKPLIQEEPLKRAKDFKWGKKTWLLNRLAKIKKKLSFEAKAYRLDDVYGPRPGSVFHHYPTVNIPVELNVKQAKQFTEWFNFEPCMVTGEPHDHPMSAAVRWMAQKLVENHIVNHCENKGVPVSYVDIFGSARLENDAKWCFMPIITADDLNRRRPLNSCSHGLLDCEHMKNASTSMSVDALYYMDVAQIAYICSQNALQEHHVLFHRMLKHSGVTNDGEYRWTTMNRDGKMFNRVLVGAEDTGNTYLSKQMDWLNVRTWYTPYGYLHYCFRKKLGPMEYGVFTLVNHKLLNEPFESLEKMTHLVSWELNAPDKNAGFMSKLLDKVKFTLGDMSGFVARYNIVEFSVPTDLYCKMVQQAMLVDVKDRAGIVMELKGRALRWRNEQIAKQGFFDEKYFTEYLPHLIASALTATMPAEFGAMHHSYVNDYCVNNPNLWKKSYSRVGRVCVSLGAVVSATVGLALYQPITLLSLPLVGAIVLASALFRAKESNVTLNPKYIYSPLTCQMMDLPDYYEFLNSFPFVKEHVDLPVLPGFNDIVGHNVQHDGQDWMRIHKPFIQSMDYDCGCSVLGDRKLSICQFLKVDGIDVVSYANCSCNMLSGLMQRYFKPVPLPNLQYWEDNVGEIIADGKYFLDTELNMLQHYPAWYKHLATHKKSSVDRALVKQDDSRYHLSKPSVKQEVTLKLSHIDKSGKPRAYFPKDDLHYAETGPYMYALKKMLNRRMRGTSTPFLFACGYNPSSLGDALNAGLNHYLPNEVDRVAHEADLRACEATMCGYNVALESVLVRESGVPLNVCQGLYGKSKCECDYKNGKLKFFMKNCRESGCANTSVGNTLVYSTLLKHCLYRHKVEKYFVLVGGDDAVVYHYISDKDKVAKAFDMLHDLGLDPEIKYRDIWNAARFYSGFFAPVLKARNRTSLTHIPSIGKAFVKAFTYRMKQGYDPESWLAETSKQRSIIWSHIPLLRKVGDYAAPLIAEKIIKRRPTDLKIDYGGFLMEEMSHKELVSTPDTFNIIEEVYGLPIGSFVELEERLAKTLKGNWGGTVVYDATLMHLLEKDLE